MHKKLFITIATVVVLVPGSALAHNGVVHEREGEAERHEAAAAGALAQERTDVRPAVKQERPVPVPARAEAQNIKREVTQMREVKREALQEQKVEIRQKIETEKRTLQEETRARLQEIKTLAPAERK